MVDAADQVWRRRLEGRVERLEAARARYRTLLEATTALRWRQRLSPLIQLLRETCVEEPLVLEALATLEQKIRREAPPRSSAVATLGLELQRLRTRLTAAALRRVERDTEGASLALALELLEVAVVSRPRAVLPGERWRVAELVLAPSLPEVQAAGRFAHLLESLFRAQPPAGQTLTLTLAEFRTLEAGWGDGEESLERVWERLDRVDPRRTLSAFLKRRASRMPLGPPRTGPQQVLAATFWHQTARRRLEAHAKRSASPLLVRPSELFPLIRWTLAQAGDSDTRFAPSAALARGRNALLELACRLNALRQNGFGDLSTIKARAHDARTLRHDDDYALLRDELRLWLGAQQTRSGTPLERLAQPRPPLRTLSGVHDLEALLELLEERTSQASDS